jgi:hypothetical protein
VASKEECVVIYRAFAASLVPEFESMRESVKGRRGDQKLSVPGLKKSGR